MKTRNFFTYAHRVVWMRANRIHPTREGWAKGKLVGRTLATTTGEASAPVWIPTHDFENVPLGSL
ncbi:MAG: hypothetical protein ABIT01_21110 [Thermoanaerobaculia bacterium]